MKRNLYYYVYLLLISIVLNSQILYSQEENFLLDSTYTVVSMPNPPNASSVISKNKYIYDFKNRLTDIKLYSSNSPQPYIYRLNYEGDLLIRKEGSLNGLINYKELYTYNSSGLVIDTTIQESLNGIKFSNRTKNTCEYNQSNPKKINRNYIWDNDKWIIKNSKYLSYNDDAMISKLKIEYFEDDTLNSTNIQTYEYDDNKNLIKFNSEYKQGDEIIRKDYTLYEYNEGLLVCEKKYYVINGFEVINNVDSIFYENNLKTLEIEYIINKEWFKVATHQYAYDKNKCLAIYKRTENTLEGPMIFTTYYFYKPKYSDVNEDNQPTSISISPNPAGNYIEITLKPSEGFEPSEGSEIAIYNTLGECVITVGNNDRCSVQINISDLPKGIYFMKIGGATAKFMKL